ncbi:uncharacterized [Tachysurus ichikawai]
MTRSRSVTLDTARRGASPEQKEEAVKLQHHADDRPPDQHHQHASEEEAGGLHLVLLEEEPERPLQADDEGQTDHKQDLRTESCEKPDGEDKRR